MARFYVVACVVGAALPLFFLGSFVVEEGVDPAAFIDQVTASDLSLMAWTDVVVAGVVVIAFAWAERGRGLQRWWLPALATVAVGPSLGLPLLLLLKERRGEAASPSPADGSSALSR